MKALSLTPIPERREMVDANTQTTCCSLADVRTVVSKRRLPDPDFAAIHKQINDIIGDVHNFYPSRKKFFNYQLFLYCF